MELTPEFSENLIRLLKEEIESTVFWGSIDQVLSQSIDICAVFLAFLRMQKTAKLLKRLAHPRGFEPLTSAFGGKSTT